MKTNFKIHPSRQFISRKETFQLTGVAMSTLAVMAKERRGPYCSIPQGGSFNLYLLSEVLAWGRGEEIAPWPETKVAFLSRRGKHLLRGQRRRAGRPNKQPKTSHVNSQILQDVDGESGE